MKRWVALSLVLFTGCVGSARVFYQDQRGGVLALEGDEGKAFEDAQAKMNAHCGMQGYQIVKRETVKVGTENYASSNTQYTEEERRKREREKATAHSNQGSAGGQSSTEGDGYGNTYSQGSGGYQSSGASASAEREREATRRQGGEQTQSVSGVRDVTEVRVTYSCGR